MPFPMVKQDPLVQVVLNRISYLMRKKYNINYQNKPTGHYEYGPHPPGMIKFTLPQALSMLKGLEDEMGETDRFSDMFTNLKLRRWKRQTHPYLQSRVKANSNVH